MPNDPRDLHAAPLTEAQRQWYARQQAAASSAAPHGAPAPFSRTAQEPVPSGSVKIRQAPSPAARPAGQGMPAPAVRPAPAPAARPAATPAQQPISAPAARPAAQTLPTPAARPTPTAVQRPNTQPAPAPVQRPAAQAAPAPAARPAATPAQQPVSAPAARPAAQTVPTPAVRPAPPPVQRPAAQTAPAAKPISVPLQQPAAQPTSAGRRINRPPRAPSAPAPAASPAAPAPASQTPARPAPAAVPPVPAPAPAGAAPAEPVPAKAAPHRQAPETAPDAAREPAKASAKKPAKKGKKKAAKKPLPPALAAAWKIVRAIGYIVFAPAKLAALAAIPLFMFWYGYTVDRNGWFQGEQYEREVAQEMLAGQSISNFDQMEEREITKLYAQNLPAAPACIAIGSSRILQLDHTLAGTDSYFNAGMIGAEYPDVMDSYYLFDRVGLVPGTVVFGVDPWLFSAGPDANTFKRVDMQMYNEFLRYGLGHTDVEVTTATENMSFWMALTSPAFFRETMDYYIDNKENGLRPSVVEGDVQNQPTDVKMYDGSLLYSTEFRDRPQDEADQEALSQIANTLVNCEEFYELDDMHVQLFEEFVEYMRGKGSQVVFFLSPFHPIAYEWILNYPQRYSGFFQVENWLRRYAAENGIPIYGSYDPTVAGCENADFFDAWHVRGSGIAKYFPGVGAIDAARAAGTLPDPMAVHPRLPTATEDPVL